MRTDSVASVPLRPLRRAPSPVILPALQPLLLPPVGEILEIYYPRRNRFDAPLQLRRRRLLLEQLHDTHRAPIDLAAIEQAPLIRRGRYLATGVDLDRGEERSFYLDFFQPRKLRTALFQPGNDPEPIAWLGAPFRPTGQELEAVRLAIAQYRVWSEAKFGDAGPQLGIFSSRRHWRRLAS